MRFHLAILLLLLGLAAAARADEVVLKSGVRFTGTIEGETETQVQIRTDLGLMTIPMKDVERITRGAGSGAEAPPPSVPEPGRGGDWSVSGLDPRVVPVAAGNRVFAVTRAGKLAAFNLIGAGAQKPVWESEVAAGAIAGIAADPGGVYLVTKDGRAARVYPGSGKAVWRANPGGRFAGAPLLFRRGLFAFQPNRGLVGIETATGEVRGLLELPVVPDTPLAAAGDSIVFGERGGRLLSVGDRGRKLAGAVRTGGGWRGRPPALWLSSVAVVADGSLLTFDTESQKVTRRESVPGLLTQPFAAESGRVFAEVEGALAAIDAVNGRIVWRCFDVPRAVAITVARTNLLVLTANDSLAWLNLSSGRLKGLAPLGRSASAPPLFAGGKVLVPLADGALKAVSPVAGSKPTPAPKHSARASRTIHSPDGYALDVPPGWMVSEQATRGAVSLGLRPDPASSHFAPKGTTTADRRLLEVSAYLAVLVVPDRGTSLADQAKDYVAEEKSAARQGGFGLEDDGIGEKEIAGKTWTTIRVTQVVDRDALKGRFVKRVFVRRLGGEQNVWIELKTPERCLETCEKDLNGLAQSFKVEGPSDFTAPAEVRVAEVLLGALQAGDVEAAATLAAEPVAKTIRKADLGKRAWKLRLLIRASIPRGQRREVRVRIDTREGTRYAALTLARESGRWVVISLGELL